MKIIESIKQTTMKTIEQVKQLLTLLGAQPSFLEDLDEWTEGLYLIAINQVNNKLGIINTYEWYAWDTEEDGPIPGIIIYKDDKLTINIKSYRL